MAWGNGNPSSHESDKASERTLFNGLAQVIVQADAGEGEVHLTATAEGLKAADVVVTVKKATPRPAVRYWTGRCADDSTHGDPRDGAGRISRWCVHYRARDLAGVLSGRSISLAAQIDYML